MQTTHRLAAKSISGLVDTGAHQLDTTGTHQLCGKLSLKGTVPMTALLDFPTTASELPVYGESALVPGTSLRLPLFPDAARIPLAERCSSCAGTGVMFDGGQYGTGMLMSCACMGLFPAESAPEPDPAPGSGKTKTWTGYLRSGAG